MKITAGTIQILPVYEEEPRGCLMGDADNVVLLPKANYGTTPELNSELEVFTFYNEERQLEATTKLPQIQLDQAGCFKVISSNDIGAFVNIGTRRDILIPPREQKDPLSAGETCMLVLKCDHAKQRLYASTRLTAHIKNQDASFERGAEVQLMIGEKMDLGRRVLINGKYLGLIFVNEINRPVRMGDLMKGYVRKCENGEITVSFTREGVDLINDAANQLLDFIISNGGYVRLNDDTSPEELKMRLHMSKKTFKKAAGKLFKDEKVTLTKLGIKLNPEFMPPQEKPKVKEWVPKAQLKK